MTVPPAITLLPAERHRRMAWANGGGETAEIAAFPEGARPGAVDWRLSMATVAEDGAFSTLPGLDRTLAVLSGEGLRLFVGNAPPLEIRPGDPPHAFPADVPTRAECLGGSVLDLNAMTRRGRWQHALVAIEVARSTMIIPDGAVAFLVCGQGAISLAAGGARVRLAEGDALRLADPAPQPWRAEPETDLARLFLASFDPLP